MIVSRLVVTDATPIDGFGGDAGVAVPLGYFRVELVGVGKLLLHELDASDCHLQAGLEPVLGQITFDSVTLDTLRIHHQDRGRPQRREPLKPGRMFFDMGSERNEGLINEVGSFLIRV